MRIRITAWVPSGGVDVPVHYNWYLQSYIYNTISQPLSSILHNIGFSYRKRKFKFFTFSRLIGRIRVSNSTALIKPPTVSFLVSSPLEEFLKDLSNRILRRGDLSIGKTILRIESIDFLEDPELDSPLKIRTLSPITVYSTLMKPEGSKKTYYYSPFEKEFSQMITENAMKKHYLLTGWHADGDLYLEPLRVREVILRFKGNFVKGWDGTFILRGSRRLIRTVYDTGLGSKNSQGFGMFEVMDDDRIDKEDRSASS